MRIDTIHDFIRELLDKEQKGWRTPAQIDTALHHGQIRVMNHYLPQYAISQEAMDALSPFKRNLAYGTDAAGYYKVDPSENYQRLTGMGIQYTENSIPRSEPVKVMTEDKWHTRKNSQLRKPSLTKPIALLSGLGEFQFYPAGVYAGTIQFIRMPKAPKYAYTVDPQNARKLVYDNVNSVQLEWAEIYQDRVILAALEFLGINLGDDRAIQVAEALAKLK